MVIIQHVLRPDIGKKINLVAMGDSVEFHCVYAWLVFLRLIM